MQLGMIGLGGMGRFTLDSEQRLNPTVPIGLRLTILIASSASNERIFRRKEYIQSFTENGLHEPSISLL